MSATHYLAVDLGAESGRVMLGTLANGRLALEEIHRFPNGAVRDGATLRWDLAHLEMEIFAGLRKAAGRGLPISGLSTDSWGVDYVLLDAAGKVLAPPFCYRDARTDSSPARVAKILSLEEIYRETGIQFMTINTLFQLEAEKQDGTSPLPRADHFLNIADYCNARYCGVAVAEQSLASTTQLYDPRARAWSHRLIEALEFKPGLFPKIVPSGSVLGPVTGELAEQPMFAGTRVVATCSHDTGAAIAAVPALRPGHWAYLSSGTWSLLGAELSAPLITDAARLAGFTHEVGLGGTIRFLKNITGLWVLQECRRAWEAEGNTYSYEELTRLAAACPAAKSHLSLADARFSSPGNMPGKIADFCRETGQPLPAGAGEITRVILESLALTYAVVLRELESLIGHKIERLHIVGGGTHNELLNQLAADATGLPVITGPVEATAIGNILIQALALGHLESAGHIRRVVETSFPTRNYTPAKTFSSEVRERFAKIAQK